MHTHKESAVESRSIPNPHVWLWGVIAYARYVNDHALLENPSDWCAAMRAVSTPHISRHLIGHERITPSLIIPFETYLQRNDVSQVEAYNVTSALLAIDNLTARLLHDLDPDTRYDGFSLLSGKFPPVYTRGSCIYRGFFDLPPEVQTIHHQMINFFQQVDPHQADKLIDLRNFRPNVDIYFWYPNWMHESMNNKITAMLEQGFGMIPLKTNAPDHLSIFQWPNPSSKVNIIITKPPHSETVFNLPLAEIPFESPENRRYIYQQTPRQQHAKAGITFNQNCELQVHLPTYSIPWITGKKHSPEKPHIYMYYASLSALARALRTEALYPFSNTYETERFYQLQIPNGIDISPHIDNISELIADLTVALIANPTITNMLIRQITFHDIRVVEELFKMPDSVIKKIDEAGTIKERFICLLNYLNIPLNSNPTPTDIFNLYSGFWREKIEARNLWLRHHAEVFQIFESYYE